MNAIWFLAAGLMVGALALLGCGASDDVVPAAVPVIHPEIWPALSSPVGLDSDVEEKIDGLLAVMTVEDKVGQIIQGEIRHLRPEDVRRYRLGSVLNGGGVQPGNVRGAAPADWLALADAFWEASMDTSDGGFAIPVIWGTDAVHGHANVIGATVFPQNIGLGATRDPELIRDIGRITATEMAVTGLDWDFSPTVAVVRDDRWGRSYEGWSEDPEIAGSYAGAMITGLQGAVGSESFLDGHHVIGCAKHFLGDGGTFQGIDQGDTLCSEAELRDIHAAGYVSALDAGVQTVMASFSAWHGRKLHGFSELLTDVLKGRMGFDGFVVGDWNAHGQLEGCSNDSCPDAFNAGIDMFMVPEDWKALHANTVAQVRSGEIAMSRLDDAVRRILRVKMRAGLFERGRPSTRPLAGRTEKLGSAEHRAVARRAVRESLVLLKNNGRLLPLDRSQTVLVAGDGADNIPKQCGGWTVTWQGTETTNRDFPGASSIWEGIRELVEGAGGTAVLSEDGSFEAPPDVAIVVFGEDPYAEYQGDRESLEYGLTRPRDVALLRRLANHNIPVVSIFLSGRPLWVNPEINASDAFVAAWLPGSEGAGVADVIFRSAEGAVNHDFSGTLSYSWPRKANQTPLNRGDADYKPLFPYGFGLRYADGEDLGELDEDSGVATPESSRSVYFQGGPVAPWRLFIGDEHNWAVEVSGARTSTWDRDNLVVTTVDRELQDDARAVRWAGYDLAHLYLEATSAIDLSRQAEGCMALAFDVMVEAAPSAPVTLGMRCGEACEGRVDITGMLAAMPAGTWRTLRVPLREIAGAGLDLGHVTTPFVLATEGSLALRFSDVRLAPCED